MNSQTTKRRYNEICKKDGEKCRNCNKMKEECRLVINHIDNNIKNNNLENLQLLCRSCVNLKYNVTGHDDMCVSKKTSNEETSLSINKEKEPLFRECVYEDLLEDEELSYKDIVDGYAEFLRISPATTKKYLDKMTSTFFGKLIKVKRREGLVVKFKSDIARKIVVSNYL